MPILFFIICCEQCFLENSTKEKKKKKIKQEKLGELQKEGDFSIESSNKTSKLDTSNWPLLLKVNTYTV